MWKTIKAWFKYSETIALVRLDVLIGFVLAVVATMDWSPLLSMDFSSGFSTNQLYALGFICVLRGVVGEIMRRRGANL
jgi:hypothetical protein